MDEDEFDNEKIEDMHFIIPPVLACIDVFKS
jgi:hypothetical protein